MAELIVKEKNVHIEPVRELPFVVRALWFFIVGWELTGIWILVAWALNASILGLPFGLWMIDRVPQVLTLKARKGAFVTDDMGSRYVGVKQNPFILRALYFIVVGWWFSLLWAALGWLLALSIIGLPLGIVMLNALPAVTTLQRG